MVSVWLKYKITLAYWSLQVFIGKMISDIDLQRQNAHLKLAQTTFSHTGLSQRATECI